MEVTIEYKEETTPPFRTETYQSFFGRTKTRQVAQQAGTSYNVYLYLIPSEEERAVILKYRVGELSFDNEPEYSPRQIDEAAQRMNAVAERCDTARLRVSRPQEIKALDDEYEHWKRELEHRRTSKIGMKLEEFFDNPFIRSFDHPQDAQVFIDRLQERILPEIKKYIDNFASRSDRLSFSL